MVTFLIRVECFRALSSSNDPSCSWEQIDIIHETKMENDINYGEVMDDIKMV